MFFLVFSVIFILGLCRVYFMNNAVSKTVEAENIRMKIIETKNGIQNLEISYLDKLNGLDISLAESLGFIPTEVSKYLYKEKRVARGSDYAQKLR